MAPSLAAELRYVVPMLRVDHIGIDARDARASAAALAEILGAPAPTPDGADDDMFRVDLEDGSFALFTPAEKVALAHVAFRVEKGRFAEVVARLRERGTPFGNDPEDPRNGRTDDPLGGAGRVYFVDGNGHLFEVTC
jgi:catechol 2,3-dioxygenase-like lactoylglutathione lyase family enzyme